MRASQFILHCFQDVLHFAGTHDNIHFGDLFEDLLAIAFDQAARHDQLARRAELLVLGHFEDGLNRLLFGRGDEAARVHHKHISLVSARSQLAAAARKDSHHHLAVDEVFRASQADESDFGHLSAPSVCFRNDPF
jgi:hypothetical protein